MTHSSKKLSFFWSTIALIVFTLINAVALYFLLKYSPDRLFVAVYSLNWLKLFVLGLAVYRMTDIIVYEKVTEPVRAVFTEESAGGERGIGRKVHTNPRSLRGFIAQLFSCNSCMGVWVAMIMVYAYIFFPLPAFICAIVIALTGLERIFSKVYNLLERK